ncbi:hypothetical protein SE959_24340 [Escherichia coli]|nr:hypothetical protein [Escherichia coli]
MQWPGINRQEIDSNESSCTTPITGVAGHYLLVLFPIILSLWIAFLWAKSEVNNQLEPLLNWHWINPSWSFARQI